MTRTELLAFMRGHRYAVQASVSGASAPQAAVVGIVVGDDLSVFFDTLGSSRKVRNLRRNRRIALVIGGVSGGRDERSVQFEGVADEPAGAELARLKERYFAAFPDGRERESWPDITYVRARPTWIRYCDYGTSPPVMVEFDTAALGGSEP
jgi:general stress protein 26